MPRVLSGKAVRTTRLSAHANGRYLFVPLDHSVSDGPIADSSAFEQLLGDVVAGGADAIVLHKGRARLLDPDLLRDCALVIHLSAGTVHAADSNVKVLVGEVEDAVRLGADAVSVHVNVGSDGESAQLADLGRIASACDRFGMPLLAMMYARGPRTADPHDPAVLSHIVNIAADLGADLVKTPWTSPADAIADVVASCPIPVLVAGGPAGDDADTIAFARTVIDAGCAGLAVGRRVFSSTNPKATVSALAEVVHGLPDTRRLLAG
jgi:2-amino-4,5-dihydroxy-6-oxo-7-(phosphonooxy)heptanoate synthase